MTNEPSISAVTIDAQYVTLFDALPGNSLLLKNDTPAYTIIAATPHYLKVADQSKEFLIGKGVFEAFPSNPNDPKNTGAIDLKSSLDQVLKYKKPHHLPEQRYDIKKEDGSFIEKYWKASNNPVFNAEGELVYIIHTVEDITDRIKAGRLQEKVKEMAQAENLLRQAPVAVCIVEGPEFIVELANEEMLHFLGRTDSMIGRPIIESLPEARLQGLMAILEQVRSTGAPCHVTNFPSTLVIDGVRELRYFNLVFKPYFQNAEDNITSSIFCVAHNVTQQILQQKNLEESEHRFRMLIEEASVATALYLGKELRIQYANDIMIGYWGKDHSVIGKSLQEAVPELNGQPFLGLLETVYTTGIPYTGIEKEAILHVGGRLQKFYYNFTYKALRDKEGQIYGVHHMAIDVTKEVLAKKKLEEAEQKARLAIESADLGTYELDLVTDEITTTQRFDAIWGVAGIYDRSSLANIIHPDDMPQRDKALQEALITGNLHYEARLVQGSEKIKWIRVRGKILYDQQKPQRLLGVVQDITEQKLFAEELKKQVEKRTEELIQAHTSLIETNKYFQQIINQFVTALASIVPVFNGDKIVDFYFKMNNAAYSLYSNLKPEELQNKRVSELFPDYFNSDQFDRYVEVYQTGKSQTWELYYNADGVERFLEVNAYKMNEEVAVHFTDFTVLKNLQLNLLHKIEELERSNQNLKEFAYAASHDLKEPVRKIHFFSDRLKHELKDKLDDKQVHLFERMEYASSRMGTLIDDLLEYSHVSAGISQVEQTDLNKKVQSVLEDLELEVQEKGAKVSVDNLPTIIGHKRQLQQLFQNLISNALKYSKKGVTPEIKISSKKVRAEETGFSFSIDNSRKEFYLIEVSDNGIGFDPEDAERIFNVFTRLHVNNEYKGTGVGLSIVRKVIENHGGKIWAESQLGQGSSFKILLPA